MSNGDILTKEHKKFKVLSVHNNSIESNFFFNPLKSNKNDISSYIIDKNRIKKKLKSDIIPDAKRIMRNSESNHGIRITKELKINNMKNTQINNNNKIDNKLDNITERKKIDLIKKNSINIDNKMRIRQNIII